jgi:hypothetical protein
MADTLGFLDPTAGGERPRLPLAPRPLDLAGATVGLLDNTKEQGDVILQTLGELLQARAMGSPGWCYGVKNTIRNPPQPRSWRRWPRRCT